VKGFSIWDYVPSHIGQNITKKCTQVAEVLAEKRQTSVTRDLGVIDTKPNPNKCLCSSA